MEFQTYSVIEFQQNRFEKLNLKNLKSLTLISTPKLSSCIDKVKARKFFENLNFELAEFGGSDCEKAVISNLALFLTHVKRIIIVDISTFNTFK